MHQPPLAEPPQPPAAAPAAGGASAFPRLLPIPGPHGALLPQSAGSRRQLAGPATAALRPAPAATGPARARPAGQSLKPNPVGLPAPRPAPASAAAARIRSAAAARRPAGPPLQSGGVVPSTPNPNSNPQPGTAAPGPAVDPPRPAALAPRATARTVRPAPAPGSAATGAATPVTRGPSAAPAPGAPALRRLPVAPAGANTVSAGSASLIALGAAAPAGGASGLNGALMHGLLPGREGCRPDNAAAGASGGASSPSPQGSPGRRGSPADALPGVPAGSFTGTPRESPLPGAASDPDSGAEPRQPPAAWRRASAGDYSSASGSPESSKARSASSSPHSDDMSDGAGLRHGGEGGAGAAAVVRALGAPVEDMLAELQELEVRCRWPRCTCCTLEVCCLLAWTPRCAAVGPAAIKPLERKSVGALGLGFRGARLSVLCASCRYLVLCTPVLLREHHCQQSRALGAWRQVRKEALLLRKRVLDQLHAEGGAAFAAARGRAAALRVALGVHAPARHHLGSARTLLSAAAAIGCGGRGGAAPAAQGRHGQALAPDSGAGAAAP